MAGVWTRNYTNLLASFFAGPWQGNDQTGTAEYSASNLTYRAINGNYYKIVNNCNSASLGSVAYFPQTASAKMHAWITLMLSSSTYSADGRLYIMLGKGAGIAGYETYQLADMITSGLGQSSSTPPITTTYDSSTHKYTRTFSLGIQNISNSDISISEIALSACLGHSSNGGNGIIYYDTFEPITLEPYESVVITISQSFPLINYEPYPVE